MADYLWLLFALLSMFSWGIGNVIAKRASERFPHFELIFWRGLFMLPFILLAMSFSGFVLNVNFIILTVAISFVGFLPLVFLYKALKVGHVGVVMSVANSSIIYTVILSVIFMGDSLSIVQVAAIGLATCGIMLVSFKRQRKGSLEKGALFAFIASIFWGLTFFLWKIPTTVIGPIATSLIIEAGIMFWGFVFLRGHISPRYKNNLYLLISLSVAGAAGSITYSAAASLYPLSYVAPVTFSSTLVSVLLARHFFKEKLRPHQYLAAIMIVAGISLMVSYI